MISNTNPTILSETTLKQLPVFGIAGNFAEHLQQAGEMADFLNVQTASPDAPKGIFPIYIPGHPSQLGCFPLCHDKILADFSQPIHLQAEPELCLYVKVTYNSLNQIKQLSLKGFTAFNDCSIRKPDARKISEKKNWGVCSKGIAQAWLTCTTFDKNSLLKDYRIASFLYHDQTCIAYGVDSPVIGYSYFHQKLIDWLIHTFNTQKDQGPLEDLATLLKVANMPNEMIITLGATRYTPFGETHYLQPNDEILILLYPSQHEKKLIKAEGRVDLNQLPEYTLVLKQTVLNHKN